MIPPEPFPLGVLLSGVAGSLIAGLGTGVGALLVFARPRWSDTSQTLMLAGAAGVMLGATAFSLVLPAVAYASAISGAILGSLSVAGGVLLGAGAIWVIHSRVPHEHFIRGLDGAGATRLGRHWLFILAITLHNFPEGMSVGISYGGPSSTSLPVTVGIGLQNLPEGLAVAAALIADGFSRRRAFAIALLTGLVEPVGGVVGALAASAGTFLLPWGLAFAGGTMLFVVSGEIIPETHRKGVEQRATFALVLGFVMMMVMDHVLA